MSRIVKKVSRPFLAEVVYGGDRNRDVLDAYEQFIVNSALSKRPTLA